MGAVAAQRESSVKETMCCGKVNTLVLDLVNNGGSHDYSIGSTRTGFLLQYSMPR